MRRLPCVALPFALTAVLDAQGDCVDQSYLPSTLTNGLEITANQSVTQTFTVRRSGQLTRIEIAQIGHHRGTPTAPLQVDLVVCDPAGVPTTASLATITLQPASVPATLGPVQIDLRPFQISAAAGQTFGIALSSAAVPSTQTYAWWGEAPGGGYARGQVFIQQTVALLVWDLAFQEWIAAPASAQSYGTGHPGTLGVPSLAASANPVIGTTPSLLVGNSLGAATFAGVFFGFQRANVPTPFGGTALVQVVSSASLALPAGGGALPFPLPPNPGLCGLVLDAQAAVLDAGASAGLALSPGLELIVGG